MGCPELPVESYFRLTDSVKKSYERLASCTEKTPYKAFFHKAGLDHETGLIYYNYRYLSPELGRFLSRDPLYERGSTAWFNFNREDEIREKIEKLNAILSALENWTLFQYIPIQYIPTLKYMFSENLTKKKNFLEFKLMQEMTGISLNCNLYAFTRNDPVNRIDVLGLITRADCEVVYDGCVAGCRCLKTRYARALCYAACMAEYAACLGSVTAERAFETLDDALQWVADNPEIVIGTVVVIGGITYLVTTGGTGAVTLVPLLAF